MKRRQLSVDYVVERYRLCSYLLRHILVDRRGCGKAKSFRLVSYGRM